MTYGCGTDRGQPENASGNEAASGGGVSQPATDPAELESGGSPDEGGFQLDVDVGDGDVRVETKGPDDDSGLEVDVKPGGGVDVNVGDAPEDQSKQDTP
jgi:hypothetical protein